jgi:hypothetical protein
MNCLFSKLLCDKNVSYLQKMVENQLYSEWSASFITYILHEKLLWWCNQYILGCGLEQLWFNS